MIGLPPARMLFRAILVATGVLACVLSHSAEPSNSSKADRDNDPVAVARREHLVRMGADRWHAAGLRGKGVKIAVLDTGFRGYRAQLGKALPPKVAVKSYRGDGDFEARDSNHGVMCGEVIHAVAPDAELLVANWEPDDPETFVEAVRWCRTQGANIISCSVVVPAWSDGEGGGAVHAELTKLIGPGHRAGDLLAVACAGNLAQRHWSGQFRNRGNGRHCWKDKQIDNTLTPWGDERVSMELCGPAGAQYALEVIDTSTQRRVAATHSYHDVDRQTATARFQPELGRSYAVRVRLVAGKPGSFHLTALGSWLEYSTPNGSIPFPGDGPAWLAVGAVDASGRRAAYSSCGPNSPQPKPDLVATVPFPTSCRSWPFSGTSAASPQVAGVAALVWARHPDWPAGKVCDFLRRSCQDLGPPGHDVETGFGRISLSTFQP